MNCSSVNLKNNTLYKIALGVVIAVSINACTTGPLELREPACVREGYFKSVKPVGGFHRCVWKPDIQRYIQYPYTCPSGLEFDERAQACIKP